MNWFVPEPISAESLVQAGLPYLEVLCAFLGVIAVVILLIALLHTIIEVRSSTSHLELHQFSEAKPRGDRLASPAQPGRQLHVSHPRLWLFTR